MRFVTHPANLRSPLSALRPLPDIAKPTAWNAETPDYSLLYATLAANFYKNHTDSSGKGSASCYVLERQLPDGRVLLLLSVWAELATSFATNATEQANVLERLAGL